MFSLAWTNTLAWINTLAYYGIRKLPIRNAFIVQAPGDIPLAMAKSLLPYLPLIMAQLKKIKILDSMSE